MKTTKKIFAALLAVMMLLVMVPFSASAATNISFDLSCEKEGYEFAVYQVATLNKTAGKYENILNIAGLSDEINDKGENTASIVSILDTAYAADANVFGTAKATFKSVDKYKTITLPEGMYYVKATKMPAGIQSSQSSLVVLPYYTTDGWVEYLDNTKKTSVVLLGEKHSESTATSDKKIVVGEDFVDAATTGYGETITYRLSASTVGSTTMKLQKYAIVDDMDSRLEFKEVTAVYLADADGNKIKDVTDYQKVTTVNGKTYTFAVDLGSTILGSDDFYAAKQVVVECTAVITKDAVISDAHYNKSNLAYQNSAGNWDYTPIKEVNVYTAGLKVKKVDAKTGEAITDSSATFGIYKTAECKPEDCIAQAETNNGVGTFKNINGDKEEYKFASGTYYLKEIKAPAGYIISEEVVTVNINSYIDEKGNFALSTTGSTTVEENGKTKELVTVDGAFALATISNSPSKLPQTGGMGTMMFTIGGAALIACAGILLFVLKRKAQ